MGRGRERIVKSREVGDAVGDGAMGKSVERVLMRDVRRVSAARWIEDCRRLGESLV